MSIFKFITLSQLRKVLSALETRFKKIEYDVENPPTPDWNQNDDTANDYIKNRICYTDTQTEEFVMVDCYGYDQTGVECEVTFPQVESIEGYQCKVSLTDEDEGITEVQNGFIRKNSGDTYYSFDCSMCSGFLDPRGYGGLQFQGVIGTHYHIVLSIEMPIIHKINSKYLDGRLIKRGLGYKSAIINNSNNSSMATGESSVSEGNSYAEGDYSHAEGHSYASDYAQHSEGSSTASGNYQHSEGSSTASGGHQHSEGSSTASGSYQHSEGSSTASGEYQHSENYGTMASGGSSHSEGYYSVSSGKASHAEGGVDGSYQSGNYIYLTGAANSKTLTVNNVLQNNISILSKVQSLIGCSIGGARVVSETFSDGIISTITLSNSISTSAINNTSKSIWFVTRAAGMASHAEGYATESLGIASHSEGFYTSSSGSASHSEGSHTIANHADQHVFGQYNIADSSTNAAISHGTYVEIVGNGSGSDSRSNARTLDWSGNEVLAGKLTVGAAPTNNMDVATKQYVDTSLSGFSSSLSGLTDTTISSPTNGQALMYDSSASKWKNQTINITSTVEQLTDTTISSPSNGQVLMYNSTTSKWENTSLPVYNGGVTR